MQESAQRRGPHSVSTSRAGEEGDELEELRLLFFGCHQLCHRLPAQLGQVLGHAAEELNASDIEDGPTLAPPVLPTKEEAEGHDLEQEPGDQRGADAPSSAGDSSGEVGSDACKLIEHKH